MVSSEKGPAPMRHQDAIGAAEVERRARRRSPGFAYDFVAGGAGDELALRRNRAALDAIEIVPRYGFELSRVATEVKLFGREYRLPVGIAPIGMAGIAHPGADVHLARAAQAARIPYVLSSLASLSIERAAELAPDCFWFQLYDTPRDDHRIALDLLRRAERAGAHVLVVTIDVPAQARRLRDIRNGLVMPFSPSLGLIASLFARPAWLAALFRSGMPVFENFRPYMGSGASLATLADLVQSQVGGSMTWETLARFRDLWPRSLVVKGIMHPEDAAQAVALGADGVVVSNHGGRQFDAAPATIDALPAVVRQLKGAATVLVDGGFRSGLDALKALALGASAVLAGRGFLYGVMAHGEAGAGRIARLYRDELRSALAQAGVASGSSLQSLICRHPGAFGYHAARPKVPTAVAGLSSDTLCRI